MLKKLFLKTLVKTKLQLIKKNLYKGELKNDFEKLYKTYNSLSITEMLKLKRNEEISVNLKKLRLDTLKLDSNSGYKARKILNYLY